MKLNRLISIIMILLDHDKISATELSKMLEVTKRTIYRDIDALNMAGIPIVTYPGVNGGISIMDSYKFDKRLFTPKDIVNILSGLGNISTVIKGKEVNNTITKLKSYIPENDLENLELQSNQIVIDFSTWRGNKEVIRNLEKIKTAIQASNKIEYFYSDKKGKKTKRTAEPYQLILRGSSWYMHAYCCLRESFRLFKLSRISSLTVCEDKFKIREFDSKPLEQVDWVLNRVISAKCIIDNSIKEQFCEAFAVESASQYTENETLVSFPFTPDEYGYRGLISWADKCRCLEPDYVREEFNNLIKKIWNKHIL